MWFVERVGMGLRRRRVRAGETKRRAFGFRKGFCEDEAFLAEIKKASIGTVHVRSIMGEHIV